MPERARPPLLDRVSVRERYERLKAEVAAHARAAGRDPGSVTILAVTKFQPVAAIREAIAAGVTDIGENYAQEAQAKFAALPPVRRHFIGHVQTNKAKAIAGLFDVVQSVDRIEAGEALARAAAAAGKTLGVLVQVNISAGERYGCAPDGAQRLAERLRALANLRVDGVMAVGPITDDRGVLRHAFECAAMTFARVGGSTLSIGMSADWREAVLCGSTMIRIGTAIFGERTRPPHPLTPESSREVE